MRAVSGTLCLAVLTLFFPTSLLFFGMWLELGFGSTLAKFPPFFYLLFSYSEPTAEFNCYEKFLQCASDKDVILTVPAPISGMYK